MEMMYALENCITRMAKFMKGSFIRVKGMDGESIFI